MELAYAINELCPALVGETHEETLRRTLSELRDDNARLQAALQAVAWFEVETIDEKYAICPWCGSIKDTGHLDACLRQLVLGLKTEDTP